MTRVKMHLQQAKKKKNSGRSFWPQLLLGLLVSLVAHRASAQELKTEILKTHQFENSKGGDLFVTIQRVENVMGVPYQLEVRGSCGETKFSERKKAPVLHVQNFCDIKLSSPELKSGDQLTFTVRDVDAKRFNRLTQKLDPESLLKLKPTCLKEPQEVSWSIHNFCS